MKKTDRKTRFPAANRLKDDRILRSEACLSVSFALNLAYAVLQAVRGAVDRSLFNGTLAFYYLTLSGIRLFLLLGHQKRKSAAGQWKAYRTCAGIMLLLNYVLLNIYCITQHMGHIIRYPGYMIYAMAAYTFYAAVAAVRNVVIYRKYNDPILSANKALSLAIAAISIYSLQSAMISAFGDSESFRQMMGNCVGACTFLLISAIAVFMIIKSTRVLRKIKDRQ